MSEKDFVDLLNGEMNELIENLPQVKSLKTEIERLTEELEAKKKECREIADDYQEMGTFYYNETVKTAELQKQVDELEEQLKKLKLAHTSLCDECADYCPRVPQAVKDRTKEILQTIKSAKENGQIYYNESFMITAQKAYGVEVE